MTPVRVLRWGERHATCDSPDVLFVMVGRRGAGLVAREPGGWTAYQRPRGPFAHRRRHVRSAHAAPAEAVTAILASPFSRRHGAGAGSSIRWTEAASQMAHEPMEVAR